MTSLKPSVRLIIALLIVAAPLPAGMIFQNFESDNGTPPILRPVGEASVNWVDRTQGVHFGLKAAKASSLSFWTGVGIQPQTGGAVNMKAVPSDRLTFWTLALPHRDCNLGSCAPGTENNVGVTFFDQSKYRFQGFEVWTTQTARYNQWTKLKVLFSQLPPDFDFQHVTKVEFKNYWPGNYFFDDVHIVKEDRVYQGFEKEERSGSTDSEYGWKWNSNDTVAVSGPGEPAREGSHSWKLISTEKWGGTGIQSQDKRYLNTNGTIDQTFWHVDLDPDHNDRLTFWIYGQPENGMDNNVNVQFYDNAAHFTDSTKVEIWGKTAAQAGHWSRITVLFKDLKTLAPDLDLRDINKIQIQCYWPGTYYIDDIRAAGPQSQIYEESFQSGKLEWKDMHAAANYRLQESLNGPDGPWRTIYSGPALSTPYARLSKSWLRVRWEEAFANQYSLPYASGWSDVVEYLPHAVVLNYASLAGGNLKWTTIPQASNYEVQSAPAKSGPWSGVYKGGVPFFSLKAQSGSWYRIRAVIEAGSMLVDATPWSRPQHYAPGQDFVRAVGTQIKDANGTGDALVLNGINLGAQFVIEPWMTGLGAADTPPLPDDWSIRERLTARFGKNDTEKLLQRYQEDYANDFDFDRLLDRDVTLARLPFYYRNFQDDDGQWLSPPKSKALYAQLDRVVNALADRGIYTIIDMHGAPGLQSVEATTGRAGFNKLFAPDGEVYRQRTEEMWRQIATHYRDNPWVLGYDLLNEPLGAAPNFSSLAQMYDRLYRAIRAVDTNHLILMEGIWYTEPASGGTPAHEIVDWDTLPPPQDRHWTNVMYQFHFYHWDDPDGQGGKIKADENFASHKAFIDQKLATAAVKQPEYNVPLLIGEFYGFNLKSIWDYYLNSFNSRGWSWTSWSYKYHDSPSTWGLFSHARYTVPLPNFGIDSYKDLQTKLSKYATPDYHAATPTLQTLIEVKGFEARNPFGGRPRISPTDDPYITSGEEFTVTGRNFGPAQNGSQLLLNETPLQIINWTDFAIQARLADGTPFGAGTIIVRTASGDSNDLNVIVQGHVPSPVLNTSADHTFTLQGVELGDTPGEFRFYPAPCSNIPPETRSCNNGVAGISFWSDTLVNGYVPYDAADLGSRFTISPQFGGELYPTMIRR